MDKLAKDIKFLESVKEFALRYKHEEVPYDRAELMQSKMFFLGMIDALAYRGYKIVKKEDDGLTT